MTNSVGTEKSIVALRISCQLRTISSQIPVSSDIWAINKHAVNIRSYLRLLIIDHIGGSKMQISDENLRGRTVIAADGQSTGEVAALFIDTSTWTIVSLRIKLSKTAAEQLGASQGLLRAATIELPVRMV